MIFYLKEKPKNLLCPNAQCNQWWISRPRLDNCYRCGVHDVTNREITDEELDKIAYQWQYDSHTVANPIHSFSQFLKERVK